MLESGIYESLVSELLESAIEAAEAHMHVQRGRLHSEEAADRLALHIGRVLRRAISSIPEAERSEAGAALVRALIREINSSVPSAGVEMDQLVIPPQILSSVLPPAPDGSRKRIVQPLTPLLDTTLLTNSRGEPRIGAQILSEIDTADRIDLVMAFIRVSGIRPLIEKLRAHCDGADECPSLRVLTTTYTGSTELKALEMLADLGAEIRISYDTTSTRLHAKAWHFFRRTGTSTAFIGSSNLTYSAQETGLEWNVRVSGVRNPDVLRKLESMFDVYWESGDFRSFDKEEFKLLTKSGSHSKPKSILSPLEIRLEPFQERLLETISIARKQGQHANLLVAATGTGKTVMAAVDYGRLRNSMRRSRLLFVAHREEILDQSLATFRHALRDSSFGEKWVGGSRPQFFEHVFASVQTLSRIDLVHLAKDHFDVVIIDEFHHAAANSYVRLLSHLSPIELLGLTATPERSDGLPVLEWFGGQITSELRLWDAIDQSRLTPFAYYGIHDGLDLKDIPWKRGRGYDVDALTTLYTSDDAWARRVIMEVANKVADTTAIRALGFCVSIEHAKFMAHHFNAAGIDAMAVWGDTPEWQRKAAIEDLRGGTLKVVFSVDLFNEGVDIPSVDTLLLLRPTESATLFLQQLGRGLRKKPGKYICTVLDFVGMHRKEFRFDLKLRALLGGTRKDLQQQVEQGFPLLPSGCHMELDHVASDIVIRSLKDALPSRWKEKVHELKSLSRNGGDVTLNRFLDETGLELADIYSSKRCWSDLLEDAGESIAEHGPHELALRRAIGRLLHVDDEERLDFYINRLLDPSRADLNDLSPAERRLARMLLASVCERVAEKDSSIEDAFSILCSHPQVLSELRELFKHKRRTIEHLHSPLANRPDCPLQIHARYTRIEIIAAFGLGDALKTRPWREGVLWLPDEGADVFAFTIDKSEDRFSPTTMYHDYAISRELIHWESQSGTSSSSPTGQRYQNHLEQGVEVMLFARQNSSERAFWFLGPARYVSHESERPMQITWKLDVPLPGDLYSQFAAAA
jgi:superfamily II DNA or RNA helicase